MSHTDSYHEGYGSQIRDLDSRLDDVERDLANLSSRVGHVDDLDYELRRIEEVADDAQRDVDNLEGELSDHVGETNRRLKKLGARLQALEALARTAGNAPVADLDTIDPEWTRLAKTALHGDTTQAGLLTDTGQAVHRAAIQRHSQALQQRRDAQQRAITAARIVATTPHTTPNTRPPLGTSPWPSAPKTASKPTWAASRAKPPRPVPR